MSKWKPTARLQAWLVRITVPTARKVDQRSNRVATRSDSLDAPLPDGNQRELRDQASSTDPAAAAGRADLASRLAAAIADLPDKYRAAVTLRFQEGLSPKEIAEHLGLPERTVRTHLLRGLQALKERVGGVRAAGTPLRRRIFGTTSAQRRDPSAMRRKPAKLRRCAVMKCKAVCFNVT